MISTNIQWDYTLSDNSHLFGRPVQVLAGWDCTVVVPMTREECHKAIEEGRFIPFELAGIDIRCDYRAGEEWRLSEKYNH